MGVRARAEAGGAAFGAKDGVGREEAGEVGERFGKKVQGPAGGGEDGVGTGAWEGGRDKGRG